MGKDEVLAEAFAALTWIDGYTHPASGPQSRIKIVDEDQSSILVSVNQLGSLGLPGPVTKLFRIHLRVTEEGQ